MQSAVCEACFAQWQEAEAQRRQHHAAARTLGLVGARSSELLGTAVGAVSAASAGAARYLVHGAVAGASSAWHGERMQEGPPRIEISLPRPAGLPPPLPADPHSSGAPIASEDAGAAVREPERRAAEQRHRGLETAFAN